MRPVRTMTTSGEELLRRAIGMHAEASEPSLTRRLGRAWQEAEACADPSATETLLLDPGLTERELAAVQRALGRVRARIRAQAARDLRAAPLDPGELFPAGFCRG